MKYDHTDKTQFNVRLSHFLYNGLEVISAQLGMSKGEVMRMAIYNLLKQNYTKEELDIFASRDDIVEEWIVFLNDPGRSKFATGSEFVKHITKKEKNELEKYKDLFDNELEKRLKPIRKKYSISYAEDFLKNTEMSPKEASKYFDNYLKKHRTEFIKYQQDLHNYFNNKYPKERKEIEAKLEKITGKTWDKMKEKSTDKNIDYMIKYHQDGMKAYKNTDKDRYEFEKEQLKHWQEMKKQRGKKNAKKKS